MEDKNLNFIEQIVQADLDTGTWTKDDLQFRFPPEPNGFLHIGHAKSICLNFGLAQRFGGKINLRFDDTNPVTEKTDYVEAIKKDIRWLGFAWNRLCYASDYFDQLFDWAIVLIQNGLAYVDDQTPELINEQKGTPTVPGKESPFRNRSVEENERLFRQMRENAFDEGSRVLRAKIDMASPNMHFRDPVIYRILKKTHHRTGDRWYIYPMYDFAHGQSDSLENVTHSICTLEFENHRPLYEWFIKKLAIFPSRQIEFARLNLNYTIMSKRKLLRLVEENLVDGWDDPRMPTISGMRRRGFTAAGLRNFAERVGIAKRENMIDVSLLEFSVREDLNKVAERRMAILKPLKLIITNYPENQEEWLEAENNPEDSDAGFRKIPFGREIWIERTDFEENPHKKYFRLKPGGMVRLKHGYIIEFEKMIKEGETIKEIHVRYVENSKSGNDTSELKVKGTLHWVSVKHAKTAKAILYDRLFNVEHPEENTDDFTTNINPNSKIEIPQIYIEPALAEAQIGRPFQFLRLGYFCLDKYSTSENLVFNRSIALRDSWAKTNKK